MAGPRNVAEEIALALGRPPAAVAMVDAPIPNVGGLPIADGTVVFATAGAVDQLARDELEALVAAQFAGQEDRWCRLATRAELVWSLVMAASVLSLVWAMAGWVTIVPMLFMARTVEHARDLCADVAAVSSTRHPDALARAMRELSVSAPVSHQLRLAPLRSIVNPFLALTSRHPRQTSVGRTGRPTRSWTSVDEITMELRLRADRAEALASGADTRRFTGREFRRRWYRLGRDPSAAPDRPT